MVVLTAARSTAAALVVTGPGAAALQRVPMPSALSAGGVGRVLAAGVCGSDLALIRGGGSASVRTPFVLGHESVVEIEQGDALLKQRWGVGPGDRVFVEEFIPCGWCQRCRGGRYQRCVRTDFHEPGALRYGRTPLDVEPGLWGGFAERLYLHPDARLHLLPPGLDAEHAALATPLANGLHWVVGVAGVQPLETVVIIGPGAHGLGCVSAARLHGAGTIVVVGTKRDRTRLEIAQSLGATHTLAVDPVDGGRVDGVAAGLKEMTDGAGADIVIEVAGSPTSLNLALATAGDGGRVVCAGNGPPADGFPVDLVGRRELTVRGVRGHRGADLARALQLLADGHFDLGATRAVGLAGAGGLIAGLAAGGAPDPFPHYVVQPHR